jgi:transcriptional regulator with AAA-type ATPase domain
MALFKPEEWSFAVQATDLVTTNPFQRGWTEKERTVLGLSGRDAEEDYSWRPGWGLWGPRMVYPNVDQLGERITDLSERLRQRLQGGAAATEKELGRYEILSLYRLYRHFGEEMDRWIDAAVRGREEGPIRGVPSTWKVFKEEHESLFGLEGRHFPLHLEPHHVFACFFLYRRAFYHIFFNIIGSSKPIARLRGAVWESIVTHDLLGWTGSLYGRMRDFPTLVTGPSGTGKELVARAIGLSQYIAFDPRKKAFARDFRKAFYPVNLSALPPLLIEAELFGHVKGSFAGAVRDRVGRLEECPEHGAVFLDEIGELTAEIQVKLLRVLQTRRFQSVGANEDKEFGGKIIAATNRNLADEVQAGRFREDFYYRLCADQIRTPSLREQLGDRPEDLPLLVEFVCRSVVGEDKAGAFARDVVRWIEEHLRGYPWPGNFRELEQCVRSYTIRKEYHPLSPGRPPDDTVGQACETLARVVLNGQAAYDEIERRLFTRVRAGTRTDKEAARLLGRDYRTLQARLKAAGRPADG